MPAILKIKALGRFPVVEISDATFHRLEQGRKTLGAAFALEEAYDIVIENQLDFEKEVLTISAENMLRMELDFERIQQSRSVLARRIANLLTTTQVYIDQAPRFTKSMLGTAVDSTAQLFQGEYDSHLSYRFMCAYRNHVQHYSVALHEMTLGGARDPENFHLAFTTIPWATKKELQRDKQVKAKLLAELPERINVLEMARGYIASLSRVHEAIRSQTRVAVDESRQQILEAQSAYRGRWNDSIAGLFAQRLSVDGAIEGEVWVSLEWDDARQWLLKRSKSLIDLQRHYVTNRISER